MAKRTDIQKILLLGSGPVMIGQAGEYDYAALQACSALKNEGYKVIFVDSNPMALDTDTPVATAATAADIIYCEPLTIDSLKKIIAKERPDALLPVFGGQIALNLAYFLDRQGILDQYQVEILGVDAATIEQTEDRSRNGELAAEIGLRSAAGAVAATVGQGMEIGQRIGFPVVIRASFAPEGAGVMVAYNKEELEDYIAIGLNVSPIGQVLIEESLYGWRELEFEVIRDCNGKCAIVSSLENIDPVGVHTGNSAVTIPAPSLSGAGYPNLAKVSKNIIQKLRVSGGINLQLALNPASGEAVLIEVNPRFTKSSALVAKATGFQIPAVTAKLAVGLGITEVLAAEPLQNLDADSGLTIDYTAVKLPRFQFEKFPEADRGLGTTMKAVGEVMALGRDFKEAFQKAIRSLMIDRYGLGADGRDPDESKLTLPEIKEKITNPNPNHWFYLRYALKMGITPKELVDLTKLGGWFIQELAELVAFEKKITTYALYNLTPEVLSQAKKMGFSDMQLAYLLRSTEDDVRAVRLKKEIRNFYMAVEPCGIAWQTAGPYFFSTYDSKRVFPDEAKKESKVLLTGSGANRIGQGAEYDYSIVHAAKAVMDMGHRSLTVNSNPSAVSTDSAHTDILYFEPVTKEDLLNIIAREEPAAAIIQFSGPDPYPWLNLLQQSGIKILGTPVESLERSANWNRWQEMVQKAGLNLPGNGIATDLKSALEVAGKIGYPVIIRSFHSLDKAVEIFYGPDDLQGFVERTMGPAKNNELNNPLFMEKYLDDAIGVVIDCIFDGKDFTVCGIMEQVEEAGINPSDCACAIPPYSAGEAVIAKIKANTRLLAEELHIKGLLNVQYAVKHDSIYLLDVSPQVDPMMPFVNKATGVDWVGAAARIMLGASIQELGLKEMSLGHTAIKEAVFSFDRFPGIDTLLGPEMRSGGAVMGIDPEFGLAFIKSQLAAGEKIPASGAIYLSIRDEDKRTFISITRQLVELGFTVMASQETAAHLNRNSIPCQTVYKVGEGRPNIIDKIKNGEIQWIISVSSGRKPKPDEIMIRSTAVQRDIPIITTVSGTQVAVIGLEQFLHREAAVKSLAGYYQSE